MAWARFRNLGAVCLAIAACFPLATRAQTPPEDLAQTPSLEEDTPRPPTTGGETEDRIRESQILTRWLGTERFGLSIDGSWLIDQTTILKGGLAPGYSRGQNLLNLGFFVDWNKAAGWKGATTFLLFQSHRGTNAHQLAGDEQFFDQLDATPLSSRGQISELWWQQILFDGKVRVKIGKVDANGEFAYVKNGLDFIHGAFGNAPTIFLLPTYPDPATGANLFLYPNKNLYGGVGFYDGSYARGIKTGTRGPETFFEAPQTYFAIGETGINFELGESKLEGRMGVGYWLNTADFLEFEEFDTIRGRNRSTIVEIFETKHGTNGWYAVWDQVLWRENPDEEKDLQGIAAFYQFGSADPRITIFETFHGLGFTWTGLLKGRDNDVTGFGIAYSGLSTDPRAQNFRREEDVQQPNPANEIAYQWFYKLRLGDHLVLQPNFTIVHDPGQSDGIPDPVAFTMRVILDF